MKALNFSLHAFSCLMILEVKNEALDHSFLFKSWHFSLLIFLLIQQRAACKSTFN